MPLPTLSETLGSARGIVAAGGNASLWADELNAENKAAQQQQQAANLAFRQQQEQQRQIEREQSLQQREQATAAKQAEQERKQSQRAEIAKAEFTKSTIGPLMTDAQRTKAESEVAKAMKSVRGVAAGTLTDATAKDPNANKTTGGFLGFGAKPTPEAQAVAERAQRAADPTLLNDEDLAQARALNPAPFDELDKKRAALDADAERRNKHQAATQQLARAKAIAAGVPEDELPTFGADNQQQPDVYQVAAQQGVLDRDTADITAHSAKLQRLDGDIQALRAKREELGQMLQRGVTGPQAIALHAQWRAMQTDEAARLAMLKDEESALKAKQRAFEAKRSMHQEQVAGLGSPARFTNDAAPTIAPEAARQAAKPVTDAQGAVVAHETSQPDSLEALAKSGSKAFWLDPSRSTAPTPDVREASTKAANDSVGVLTKFNEERASAHRDTVRQLADRVRRGELSQEEARAEEDGALAAYEKAHESDLVAASQKRDNALRDFQEGRIDSDTLNTVFHAAGSAKSGVEAFKERLGELQKHQDASAKLVELIVGDGSASDDPGLNGQALALANEVAQLKAEGSYGLAKDKQAELAQLRATHTDKLRVELTKMGIDAGAHDAIIANAELQATSKVRPGVAANVAAKGGVGAWAAEKLPFVGGVIEATRLLPYAETANKLERGEQPSKEELDQLNEFVRFSQQNRTFAAQVVDGIASLPGFAIELASTEGIANAVKLGGMKGLTMALKKMATSEGRELMSVALRKLAEKQGATNLGKRFASGLAQEAVRLPFASAGRVAEKYMHDAATQGVTLTPDETNLVATIDRTTPNARRGNVARIADAVADTFIENLSERSGRWLGYAMPKAARKALTKMAAPVKERLFKTALVRSLVSANPGVPVSTLSRVLAKANIGSPLSEMGEERVGDLARDLWKGVSTGQWGITIPTTEQLASEFVTFLVPGAKSALDVTRHFGKLDSQLQASDAQGVQHIAMLSKPDVAAKHLSEALGSEVSAEEVKTARDLIGNVAGVDSIRDIDRVVESLMQRSDEALQSGDLERASKFRMMALEQSRSRARAADMDMVKAVAAVRQIQDIRRQADTAQQHAAALAGDMSEARLAGEPINQGALEEQQVALQSAQALRAQADRASALIKIARGRDNMLTAQEQRALGDVVEYGPQGSIITDAARDELRQIAPAAADYIRQSETQRREELATATAQTTPQQGDAGAGTGKAAGIAPDSAGDTAEGVVSDGTTEAAPAAGEPKPGVNHGRGESFDADQWRSNALALTAKMPDEAARQHAVATIGAAHGVLRSYGKIFEGGVEFAGSGAPGGLSFDPDRKALAINLKALALNTRGLQGQELAEFLDDRLNHEVIHVAADSVLTKEQVANAWKRLGKHDAGKRLMREVERAYFAAYEARNEKPPAWTNYQAGHELLRMMVQDKAFAHRISEAVAVDKGLLADLRDFLLKIADWLNMRIAALPASDRTTLESHRDNVIDALRAMGVVQGENGAVASAGEDVTIHHEDTQANDEQGAASPDRQSGTTSARLSEEGVDYTRSKTGNPGVVSRPSAEIIAALQKLATPSERLEWLRANGYITLIDGATHVDYSGRVFVLARIGTANVPFYISTGMGGKKNVAANKWYPVWGIDGVTGWINKGDEKTINDFYTAPVLAKIAKILNEGVGFIDADDVAHNLVNVAPINDAMGLGITPVGNHEAVKFWANVNTGILALNEQLRAMGDAAKPETSKPAETPAKPAESAKKPDYSRYSEEQQALLRESDEQHAKDVANANSFTDDRDTQQKKLKAAGMRHAARFRQITGKLTAKERAAKDAYEASNHVGKAVSVDGVNGEIVGHAFGRVQVKLATGEVKTVDAEKIGKPAKSNAAQGDQSEGGVVSASGTSAESTASSSFGAVADAEPTIKQPEATSNEIGQGRDNAPGEEVVYQAPEDEAPATPPAPKATKPKAERRKKIMEAINPPDEARNNGFKASDAAIEKARKAFEGLGATERPTIEQTGLPRDRRAAFMDLADTLIEDGIKQPEELAAFLDRIQPDGRLRKFSQAMWNYLGTVSPELSGTHDWISIYATKKAEQAPEPEFSPSLGQWVIDAEGFMGPVIAVDENGAVTLEAEGGEEQTAKLPVKPTSAPADDTKPSQSITGSNVETPAAMPVPETGEASPVDQAAHEAATSPLNDRAEPTQAQKEAGNYKLGHLNISGLDISVENPAGSERKGTDKGGKAWSVTMADHYGYVKGTESRDGDHIDIFVEPGTPEDFAGPVFVVNQKDTYGEFDEHKAVLGPSITTAEQARAEYLKNYSPGWKGAGDVVKFDSATAFKAWATERQRRGAVRQETADKFAVNEAPVGEQQTALSSTDAPQVSEIDRRIADAEASGVVLSDADKAKIRKAFDNAEDAQKQANRLSGASSDPLNKGNSFPMGVGFTRMTKRTEQRIDASVKKAGEAVKFFNKAKLLRADVEALLAGKGTEADKAAKADKRKRYQAEVAAKLLTWKKGDKIASFTIERVNMDRDGYPSSYTISGEGIVKGVHDKVDVVKEIFGGDKQAFRKTIDEARVAQQETKDGAAAIADAPQALAAEVSTPEPVKESQPVKGPALTAQKKFLLEKIDDAIAEAPAETRFSAKTQGLQLTLSEVEQTEEGSDAWKRLMAKLKASYAMTSKLTKYDLVRDLRAMLQESRRADGVVTIEIPGDGTFTILNNKKTLREFKDMAKSFPTTVPKPDLPTATALRASGIPALAKGKVPPQDKVRVVGLFAAKDDDRPGIKFVADTGDAAVATDGRVLFFIEQPGEGSQEKPVFYKPTGGKTESEERYPQWRQVVPKDARRVFSDIDTGRLWQIARQASAVYKEAVREEKANRKVTLTSPTPRIEFWKNADGSLGIATPGYTASEINGSYEHNVTPGAESIGVLDADYVMEVLRAMRALGNDSVNIGVAGTQTGRNTFTFDAGDAHAVVMEMAAPVDAPATPPAQKAPKPSELSATERPVAVSADQDAAYMRAVESGDMETAQRMVDAAAKAAGLVAGFHGTPRETRLAPNEFKTTGGSTLGAGAYFSEDKTQADRYDFRGDAQMYFLDVELPGFDEFNKGLTTEEIVAGKTTPLEGTGKNGGWIVQNGEVEFVVRDPSQIKSADPVTRDESGNVIPLSQRFNSDSNSILYATERPVAVSADQDAAYMRAVESGDMETAQRMVDEAAQDAEYAMWFHGNTPEFGAFAGDSMGVHFGDAGAAQERLNQTGQSSGIVRGHYVKLTNPVRLKYDPATWYPAEFFGSLPKDLQKRMDAEWEVDDSDNIIEALKEYGYDGISYPNAFEGGDSILVFNESAIKSAEPITRDEKGGVIPLSQRFNSDSNSILYATERPGLYADPEFAAAMEELTTPGESPFIPLSDAARDLVRDTAGAKYGPDFTAEEAAQVAMNLNGGITSAYQDQREREKQAGWIATAAKILQTDGLDSTADELLADPARLSFNPVKVKLALMVADQLAQRALLQRSPADRDKAERLMWAYNVTGTQAGRAVAARDHVHASKEELHRRAIANKIFTPPAHKRAAIERAISLKEKNERIAELERQLEEVRTKAAESERGILGRAGELVADVRGETGKARAAANAQVAALNKQIADLRAQRDQSQLLAEANQARIAAIEADLARDFGLTLHDLFVSREALVRLRGSAIVKNALTGFNQKEALAQRLRMEGKSDRQIQKQTGISEKALADVFARVDEALTKQLEPWLDRGFSLGDFEQLDDQGNRIDPAKIIDDKGNLLGATLRAKITPEEKAARLKAILGAINSTAEARNTGALKRTARFGDGNNGFGFDLNRPEHAAMVARAIQRTDGNASDMIYEYWINGLLSGPATQTANIAGNTASMALEFAIQRPLEAMINATIFRDAAGAQLGEFRSMAKYASMIFATAVNRAKRAWQTEISTFDAERLDQPLVIRGGGSKNESEQFVIGGTPGRVIRTPSRLLNFADEFSKYLIGGLEAAAQAHRLAKANGLTGEEFDKFVASQVNTNGSQAWLAAVDKAHRLTFTSELPDMLKKANDMLRDRATTPGGAALKFFLRMVFPFVRTPYNIFATGLRKTPLGTLRMAGKATAGLVDSWKGTRPFFDSYPKAALAGDMAEQLVGWVAALVLAGMAEGDPDDERKHILITGTRSQNDSRGEAQLLNRTRGGETTILINGKPVFNYGRIEPFATVISTLVDAIREWKKVAGGEPPAKAIENATRALADQARSKTFLQGFDGLMQLIDGRTRSLPDAAVKAIVTGAVPNLVRQPLKNIDDYARDTRNAPWYYQALPLASLAEPLYDLYGRPIVKDFSPLGRLALGSGTTKIQPIQPADRALERWNKTHEGDPQQQYNPVQPSVFRFKDAQGKWQQMRPDVIARFRRDAGRAFAADAIAQFASPTAPAAEEVRGLRSVKDRSYDATKKNLLGAGVQPPKVARPMPTLADLFGQRLR